MRDLRLASDGDLWLGVDPETGQRVSELVGGRQQVAQHIGARLRTWLGEWFLDLRAGVDYRGTVFVKAPNVAVVNAGFREVILGTPGVTGIRAFEPLYEPRQRRYSLTFTASTTFGDVTLSVDAALDASDIIVLFDAVGEI